MTEWGRVIILYCCNDSLLIPLVLRQVPLAVALQKNLLWVWVLYRILSLLRMHLAINVTNLCNFVGKMVCVCVWVSVYLELLSHFLPFKIHLTNISPILIKMADFKNLAWATSFATRASRKFIYLPYKASWKKKVLVIPCACTFVYDIAFCCV